MGFDALVNEGFAFEGWDFSVFGDRISQEPTPWDYQALAADAARDSISMADMGTGGGEFLAELLDILGDEAPHRSTATEAWEPNVPMAKTLLERRGVNVVAVTDDSQLPLADGEFDLVINRHESFDPVEVQRILQPGGCFLTQQVGGRNLAAINAALGTPPPAHSSWSLEPATQRLRENGFVIERAQEAMVETRFSDIGALVGFLRVITWQVPGFSVERYRDQLHHLHDRIWRRWRPHRRCTPIPDPGTNISPLEAAHKPQIIPQCHHPTAQG